MADTPINIPHPGKVPIGRTADGKDVFINPIWQKGVIEAILRRLGGSSNYFVSDITAITASDGVFLVGDGSSFVGESGATARTSLGLGTIATQNANNVAITGGSVTGITDLALADGGTGQSLADPGADRLMFWDDSESKVDWLTLGTNLSISGTTINASGGSGGALVALEQHTASASASLDFTSFYSSTYDEYLIDIVDLVVATDNVTVSMQYSSDGGANWNSTNNYYSRGTGVANGGGAFAVAGGNPTSSFTLATGVDNSTSRSITGSLRATAFGSTALDKQIYGNICYSNQTNGGVVVWFGILTVAATAFNAFKVFASSGNLASGTIRVYGIAKS